MKCVALDTSVLIAGMLTGHAQHALANPWLVSIATGLCKGYASLHAIVETYHVLTKHPTLKLAPNDAKLLLDRTRSSLLCTELNTSMYDEALRRCASRGLAGGVVFDALHLCAARSVPAAAFLTFNDKDFTRLLEPGDPFVWVPNDPPAVALANLP